MIDEDDFMERVAKLMARWYRQPLTSPYERDGVRLGQYLLNGLPPAELTALEAMTEEPNLPPIYYDQDAGRVRQRLVRQMPYLQTHLLADLLSRKGGQQ